MDVKLALLSKEIAELVIRRLDNVCIDADKIADTAAQDIVARLNTVIHKDGVTDFEVAEELVSAFSEYNIDTGAFHDF